MSSPLIQSLFHSATIALVATLVAVVSGVMSIALFHSPGRAGWSISVLLPLFIAGICVLLPLSVIAAEVKLTSPPVALIIIFAAIVFPNCIWQIRSRSELISEELMDAAKLDGCSGGRAFRLITLPQIKSAVATSAFFSAIIAWTVFGVMPLLWPDLAIAYLPLERGTLGLTEALLVSTPLLVLFLLLAFSLLFPLKSVAPNELL